MRDIVLTAFIFLLLPLILFRPFWGVLAWNWLAYFNPHKATYSFARQLPFSELVGGVTLFGWLFSREPKRLPNTATVWLWIAFIAWMCVTTLFAQVPELAPEMLSRVAKVQVFALLAVAMTVSWARLRALIWVSAASLGFFGFKGGMYVIATGGSSGKVWGPSGTFIEGNNELALALLMTLPLLLFLYRTAKRRLVRFGLGMAMVLISFSVAGSFSRGALLAAAALLCFLAWRSKRRARFLVIGAATIAAVLLVMPSSWFERAETIRTYQEDTSALKRLNTWTFLWEFSKDNPVLGGGFLITRSNAAYSQYAPRSDEGWVGLDAHNIYLQVLGEHGFIGLMLFVALGLSAWIRLARIARQQSSSRESGQMNDAELLAVSLQASLLAFAVGGMFLGLAYFDLPYSVLGMSVILASNLRGRPEGSSCVPEVDKDGCQEFR